METEVLMRIDPRRVRAVARDRGTTVGEIAETLRIRLDRYLDGGLDVEASAAVRLARHLGVGLETLVPCSGLDPAEQDSPQRRTSRTDHAATVCAAVRRCNDRLSREGLAVGLGWTLARTERALHDADRACASLGLHISADLAGRVRIESEPDRFSAGQRIALDQMSQNSPLATRHDLQCALLGVGNAWYQREHNDIFDQLAACGYVQPAEDPEDSGWVPTHAVSFSLDPEAE